MPFHRPTAFGIDGGSLTAAVRDPDGALERTTEQVRAATGAHWAALTPSCTAALELVADLVEVAPGDEVVLPSFAFVTAASAFTRRGARLRFVDLDPETLSMDPDAAAEACGRRTRVVVHVHYGGHVTDLSALLNDGPGPMIVEDCAHSFPFASPPALHPRRVRVASFHRTKNLQCGEGGALALDDDRSARAAQLVLDKGTDRARFLAQLADRYRWVAQGGSYTLSELLAPVLSDQLDRIDELLARRAARWRRYHDALATWRAERGVTAPQPSGASAHHVYAVVLPDADSREAFLAHLTESGIGAATHYEPLHRSPMGRRVAVDDRSLPITDRVVAGLVRLPLYDDLTDAEQDRVIEAVLAWPG